MNYEQCSECYDNEIKFWREQPMNEEIRKHVTYQRHANLYYHSLDDAMGVWGTQIEGNENEF
jgi:hypothetical protein